MYRKPCSTLSSLTCSYVVLLLFIGHICSAIAAVYSLSFPFPIDSMGISPVSLRFNNGNQPSDWVYTIFGAGSVWYSDPSIAKLMTQAPLSFDELLRRNITLRYLQQSNLPFINQQCAIEILGFARLEVDRPFLLRSKYEEAGFGNASVSWRFHGDNPAVSHLPWSCIYRSLHENWRTETHYCIHYRAVLFYCPSPVGKKSCGEIRRDGRFNHENSDIDFNLTVSLRHMMWHSNFSARLLKGIANETVSHSHDIRRSKSHVNNFLQRTANLSKNNSSPEKRIHSIHDSKQLPSYEMVVCGVIPYTTHDPDKARANGAMLQEWIHYYHRLGFRVIIYDRDGENRQFIYNTTHSKLLGMGPFEVVYHNYTIRGLLDPTHKIHYDNSEPLNATDSNRKFRYESQGHDKVRE